MLKHTNDDTSQFPYMGVHVILKQFFMPEYIFFYHNVSQRHLGIPNFLNVSLKS